MLIVGAKGFAKELLEVIIRNNSEEEIVFYDDISNDLPELLFNKFRIIRNIEEASNYFQTQNPSFCLGVGNPNIRKYMEEKLSNIGGILKSTISIKADIGNFEIDISDGANILDGAKISNSVKIGKAALIYYNSIITHDCNIGKFVEISPNATILGRATIGDFVHVGASATILPDITIGNNVTIGAGAVVTQSIPDNAIVVGVPAKIIKYKNG